MSTLCLNSAALQQAILEVDPEQDWARDAVVFGPEEADTAVLDDVEFWVPGFLETDLETGRRLVSRMSSLKVIQTQSAGVDLVLPLVPEGVTLCNARGVHTAPTAEWALAAILAAQRELLLFQAQRLEHRWNRKQTDELTGKRVLVVGAGDIGRALARRLEACEAHVDLVGRTARAGVRGLSELPGLLAGYDIVVLLVPQTVETTGLVDAAFLAAMPDGALLVNAARGPVVDTAALLAELDSGRLRAALDVTDPEPLPADHPLWDAPNLLITPHTAGSVLGLGRRVAELVADQLRRYRAGEPLSNVIGGDY